MKRHVAASVELGIGSWELSLQGDGLLQNAIEKTPPFGSLCSPTFPTSPVFTYFCHDIKLAFSRSICAFILGEQGISSAAQTLGICDTVFSFGKWRMQATPLMTQNCFVNPATSSLWEKRGIYGGEDGQPSSFPFRAVDKSRKSALRDGLSSSHFGRFLESAVLNLLDIHRLLLHNISSKTLLLSKWNLYGCVCTMSVNTILLEFPDQPICKSVSPLAVPLRSP